MSGPTSLPPSAGLSPEDLATASDIQSNALEFMGKGLQVGRRFVLAAGAATLFWPGAARALGIASAIRVHNHDTHTRFVLELSEQVDFSIFRLDNPYRVVVDLPELDWAVGNNAPASAGLVRSVRFGLFQTGNARIVVDLVGPADIKNAFVLPATGGTPFRFVVDLATTSREKFMAVVGPQHRIGQFGAPASTQQATVEHARQAAPPKPDVPEAKSTNRKKIIALDPGHGGVDPGAIGVSGIFEKAITLAAARQLKTRLEATGRYRVFLTRDRDVSLGLSERRAAARNGGADLLISLHADSMANKSVRGLSVYTLSEKASDREAETLAEQENSADSIIGVDLSHESQEVRHILVDLAQRESMNLATKLATRLVNQLRRDITLVRNSHRFARFAVLKSPDIPSVLIEMGYLSNKEDEAALRKEPYRAKLMAAVVRGVDEHFGAVQSASRL
jgi:N-acetylmuramoyl-L-alanine amidase